MTKRSRALARRGRAVKEAPEGNEDEAVAFHTLQSRRATGACKGGEKTPFKADSEQAGDAGSIPVAPTRRGFV